LEDLSIDGMVVLGSKTSRVEGVDWVHLAQDRDHWRALVNME